MNVEAWVTLAVGTFLAVLGWLTNRSVSHMDKAQDRFAQKLDGQAEKIDVMAREVREAIAECHERISKTNERVARLEAAERDGKGRR